MKRLFAALVVALALGATPFGHAEHPGLDAFTDVRHAAAHEAQRKAAAAVADTSADPSAPPAQTQTSKPQADEARSAGSAHKPGVATQSPGAAHLLHR